MSLSAAHSDKYSSFSLSDNTERRILVIKLPALIWWTCEPPFTVALFFSPEYRVYVYSNVHNNSVYRAPLYTSRGTVNRSLTVLASWPTCPQEDTTRSTTATCGVRCTVRTCSRQYLKVPGFSLLKQALSTEPVFYSLVARLTRLTCWRICWVGNLIRMRSLKPKGLPSWRVY